MEEKKTDCCSGKTKEEGGRKEESASPACDCLFWRGAQVRSQKHIWDKRCFIPSLGSTFKSCGNSLLLLSTPCAQRTRSSS